MVTRPNRQYLVSETVRNGVFGLPKTGKRLIDLPDFPVEKLARHVRSMQKAAMESGGEVGHLFPGVSQRIIQGALKRACRLAKIRIRSPHDLRHTYATLLLMDRHSPAYVQKQLGHSSITMTVDVYGHWMPGEGRTGLSETLAPQKAKGQSKNQAGLWSI